MKKHRSVLYTGSNQNNIFTYLTVCITFSFLRMARGPATDHEKLKRRRKYEEKQREIRRKKRLRKVKVISSKVRRKKKLGQVAACPECGDFHYKKSDVCRVRELKVKMIVQQIMTSSKNIKENMSTVWRNLELLEETYEQIFLKTHRIQANRVCLGDLTGVDFRGEKHPVNCPCEKRAAKERLDKERLERRRREEEEARRRKEQEERRKEKQKRLDQQLEMKKKQFYRKMNGSEASARLKSEASERSRLDILKEKTSKIIEHFPELRSGRSSLVVIDGELKSLTSEFIEQVGSLSGERGGLYSIFLGWDADPGTVHQVTRSVRT